MEALTALFLACALAPADEPAKAAVPFAAETLHYTVNWPSGLSLGEARMQAAWSGEEWRFEFVLDASIPGYTVRDEFRSIAAKEFCSREFAKNGVHGKRKSDEKTTFDVSRGVAVRQTGGGGGKSEMQFSGCARDALAFLYYMRRELAQGRIPAPQTVYFGAPYQVRLEYGGAQAVRANEKPYTADRVLVSFKGPASQTTFEMFFAQDAARTPVIVRVPLALGSFSMELAP
jgi:hypothetical protein